MIISIIKDCKHIKKYLIKDLLDNNNVKIFRYRIK